MYCDLWWQYIKVWELFKGGNYSRAETICGNTVVSSLDEENIKGEKNIQGRKLYEEILYSRPVKKTSTFFLFTWQAARECNAAVNEK